MSDAASASRSSRANWKMHHDHLAAIQVVQKLSYRLDENDYEACDVVLCPPFTDLRSLQTTDRGRPHPDRARRAELPLGGPGRVHRRGEPADARQAATCSYVIVGHSERRELFGETDEIGEQEAPGGARSTG